VGFREVATERALWWTAFALLIAVLLGPLLIVEVPPVLDYPNHLARLVLLASGPDDPVLGRVFVPRWAVIPDLAIDLIGPPLLRVLPVHVVGRCLLAGVLLLNLAGVLALHRALFGRRSFWPLASGLVAYNITFLFGFLNWEIGSGLAMLFAAAWLTWRESRPLTTIAGAAVAAVVLFFCHLMGLMFFLATIGSAEAHAMWRGEPVPRRLAALSPVLLGPLLLTWLAPLRDADTAAHWVTPHLKLINAGSPFINYAAPLDIFTALLVYGGVAFGVATGWLIVAPRAVVAIVAMAFLYIVLPFDFMGGAFVDTRVSIMFGFLLFAAVEPVRRPPAIVVIGLAALFVVRMGVVAEAWMEHRRDLADFRAVIASVPPGATVITTNVPPEEAPAYWELGPSGRRLSNTLRAEYHLPALLLIEHGAFWPTLFANPAQQPIGLRPRYGQLAREGHDLPSHAALVADPDNGAAAVRDFDFLLMLEAGADPDPAGFMPNCLVLLSQRDIAALFRVRHDGACVSAPHG
jgi:hypothetical protein